MLVSKARGSYSQMTQMVGMKGLIVNPAGNMIDFPIIRLIRKDYRHLNTLLRPMVRAGEFGGHRA